MSESHLGMNTGSRNGMYGTVWIHNSELNISKQVKIEDVNTLINNGWDIGRVAKRVIDKTKPAHFRCWINDGSKSKFVLKSEVKKFIENGWKLGRLSFIR